jgi:putative flippase GtrA
VGHRETHDVPVSRGDALITLIRWLKFNAVGIVGAGVQLAALWLFARVLSIQYVAATVLAVEVAVLHNFAWHEIWTWRGLPAEGRLRRLARFHLANGFVSVLSNAAFTWLFKQWLGAPLLVANGISIVLTALLNFVMASVYVFPSQRIRKPTV